MNETIPSLEAAEELNHLGQGEVNIGLSHAFERGLKALVQVQSEEVRSLFELFQKVDESEVSRLLERHVAVEAVLDGIIDVYLQVDQLLHVLEWSLLFERVLPINDIVASHLEVFLHDCDHMVNTLFVGDSFVEELEAGYELVLLVVLEHGHASSLFLVNDDLGVVDQDLLVEHVKHLDF